MSDNAPALFTGESGSRFISNEELRRMIPLGRDYMHWERELVRLVRVYAETHPGFRLTIEDQLQADGITIRWRTKG